MLAGAVSFAETLTAKSAECVANMDQYIQEVKKQCLKVANKGFTSTTVFVDGCLSKPEEVKEEVERLGLQVDEAESIGDAVLLKVRWPGPKRGESAEDQNARRAKRRRVSKAGEDVENFASTLKVKSAECIPNIDKHINEVKKKCVKAAEKGFTSVTIYLHDCLNEPEELRVEAEMLGLQIEEANRISEAVLLKVRWSGSAPNLCPSGLQLGNIRSECKVCLGEETMCRLHPCGHVIGKNCAGQLLGQPCPFCRQSVRFVHAIFEP